MLNIVVFCWVLLQYSDSTHTGDWIRLLEGDRSSLALSDATVLLCLFLSLFCPPIQTEWDVNHHQNQPPIYTKGHYQSPWLLHKRSLSPLIENLRCNHLPWLRNCDPITSLDWETLILSPPLIEKLHPNYLLLLRNWPYHVHWLRNCNTITSPYWETVTQLLPSGNSPTEVYRLPWPLIYVEIFY